MRRQVVLKTRLLLSRLMGQYCFARWRLSSSVTLPAGGQTGRRARGRSGGRHCTAGQYGYVPLGRHLVLFALTNFSMVILCFFSSLTCMFVGLLIQSSSAKLSGPRVCRYPMEKQTHRQTVGGAVAQRVDS